MLVKKNVNHSQIHHQWVVFEPSKYGWFMTLLALPDKPFFLIAKIASWPALNMVGHLQDPTDGGT
jgi:hypothetical protein